MCLVTLQEREDAGLPLPPPGSKACTWFCPTLELLVSGPLRSSLCAPRGQQLFLLHPCMPVVRVPKLQSHCDSHFLSGSSLAL